MREEIKETIKVLRKGDIILYPTDTIWGIGCDATNPDAVKRIYDLKKRSDTKSMLVLVDSPGVIPGYIDKMPDIAWDLIELADSPLTIIYSGAKNLAANLISEDKTIGIRVARDEFCQNLIKQFRKPIVSTSANISGDPSPANYTEISESIKQGVDHIVNWNQDKISQSKPSSIIKLEETGEIQILRK